MRMSCFWMHRDEEEIRRENIFWGDFSGVWSETKRICTKYCVHLNFVEPQLSITDLHWFASIEANMCSFNCTFKQMHMRDVYGVANVNQFTFIININVAAGDWEMEWRTKNSEECTINTCMQRIELIQSTNIADLSNPCTDTRAHSPPFVMSRCSVPTCVCRGAQ